MAVEQLSEGTGLVPFVNSAGTGTGNIKGKKVQHLGTAEDFLKTYTTVKQVQRLIDFKANYIIKDGYFITGLDEENKNKVEQFFATIPVEEILMIWAKNAMIYGNAYLEFTGDNLIPRDSRKMFIYIDEEGHGQIVKFVQELGNDVSKYPQFDPGELLMLKNNPLDHLRGLSDLVGYQDIINLDDAAMQDIGATLNRQAYPRKHYVIGSKENPIPVTSDRFTAAQDLITNLLPGDDVVTNHEVQVNDLATKQTGGDFKDFVQMINERLCMQAGVPSDFWFGPIGGPTIESRKSVFEQSEIMIKRKQIEDIINRELIPQLISQDVENPVLFKFGDINAEKSFIQGKIDLIHLQTGAITPDELRLKKGLAPTGQPTQVNNQQQIPISSKDETASGTIGGNLTGARPTNG